MIRQQMTAKNPATNENERKETNEFKQKQIKNLDEFNDEEERKIKEKAEKRLSVKRLHAEESKAKKLQLIKEAKAKEGEMWNRLAELNGEFKKIKQSKKEAKKMSATAL